MRAPHLTYPSNIFGVPNLTYPSNIFGAPNLTYPSNIFGAPHLTYPRLQTQGRLTASGFPKTNAGRLPLSPGVAVFFVCSGRVPWATPHDPVPASVSRPPSSLACKFSLLAPGTSSLAEWLPRSYPVLNVPFREHFTQPNLQGVRVIPANFLIVPLISKSKWGSLSRFLT